MAKVRDQRPRAGRSLHQQMASFEEEHPNIAEAMRLFGITMVRYQDALNGMYGPHVYMTYSSSATDQR